VLDRFEPLIDAPGHCEGIEAIALSTEPGHCLLGENTGGDDAFQRGLRGIVGALEPGTNPGLGCEFDRRQEEILELAQFVVVKVVDRREGLWRIEAGVAKQLAHMSPVFLLDMGVVVFLVRSSTRELDAVSTAVVQEMVVDEFRTVVGVDSEKSKGERCTDMFEGIDDVGLAFAQYGAGFYPGGMDIRDVERVDKFPLSAVARMRDQVDLHKSRGVTSQETVLMGIWCLSSVPGLVRP